ncbi:MAG: YopX family protein [Oscillospiraceae bacterium]|nr:YopX family protein [Oscillospiraceae bacterium]
MRQIKFRAKNKQGDWVYGDLIHGVGSKSGKIYILPVQHIYPKGCNELDGWDVNPETVGQFTGSVDIDGNEIYEGDILKTRVEDVYEPCGYVDIYNEVRYVDGSFGMIGEITCELLPFYENPIDVEVVAGNIYENKDLLK